MTSVPETPKLPKMPSMTPAPGGVIGGARAGYQYQFNQLVLGVEGSVDGTSQSAAGTAILPYAFRGSTVVAHSAGDTEGTIRGKMGIALDRDLIYGTGGVAFGGPAADISLTAPNHIAPFFASTSTSASAPAGRRVAGSNMP